MSDQQGLNACADGGAGAATVPPERLRAGAICAWRALGASVKGATHEKSGVELQDRIKWWPESSVGPPMIMAVADGHGSAKCFRSARGAELATQAAVDVLQQFLQGVGDPVNLTRCKRAAEEDLPAAIERRWRAGVENDLTDRPLTVPEVKALAEKEGDESRKKVEGRPHLTYGCTLLATLVHREFVLALQLGDGEILVVPESGEVSQPIPGDSRLFGNETTSLSDSNAQHEFRSCFQALSGTPPALILLCTDGYANAMEREFLHQAAREYLEALQTEGIESVQSYLPESLNKASIHGSGDDVTLGILWRTDATGFVSVGGVEAAPGEPNTPGSSVNPDGHDKTKAPNCAAEESAHPPHGQPAESTHRRLSAVAVTAAFIAVLLIAASVSGWQASLVHSARREARAQRQRADKERHRAERESRRAVAAEAKAAPAEERIDREYGKASSNDDRDVREDADPRTALQSSPYSAFTAAEKILTPFFDSGGASVEQVVVAMAAAYEQFANKAIESGDFSTAEDACTRGLAMIGQCIGGYKDLDARLHHDEDLLRLAKRSLDDLDIALSAAPDSVPTLLRIRGIALAVGGRLEDAAKTADGLVTLEPSLSS